MLIEATSDLASRITGAIRSAARSTGASFEYLLKTAQRESNLNPSAKAPTSSASGLFQFIDQTWLQTLKTSGPSLGYGQYADGIVRTESGRYVVPDPDQRREIMQLRKDPVAASAMAGAFTQSNAAYLQERLGRTPTEGELYIAHFLGPSGAAQLINKAEQEPGANAANLFPSAARANRSIFYQRGQSRSAAEVYNVLVAKHQNTPMPVGSPQTAVAQAGSAKDNAAAAPVGAASSSATAFAETPRKLADAGPAFHSLFRTERETPVSQVVSELWSAKGLQPVNVGTPPRQVDLGSEPASAPSAGRPLQLFRFLRPEIRSSGSSAT
ncbi:MAG: lytic transglycosylase domain-containing protein [Variibacter sp.]|nr:lytic transglycosylase domain-containing protein [Variibacter sp.]